MKPSALEELPMWVVTERPRDYPEHYVARLNVWDEAGKSYVPTLNTIIRRNREELDLVMIGKGLTFLPRDPNDAAVIVGVWL